LPLGEPGAVGIVAGQFSPLTDAHVFSNEASLLLPASTFARTYYALEAVAVTR
jgi:hypothetical protein